MDSGSPHSREVQAQTRVTCITWLANSHLMFRASFVHSVEFCSASCTMGRKRVLRCNVDPPSPSRTKANTKAARSCDMFVEIRPYLSSRLCHCALKGASTIESLPRDAACMASSWFSVDSGLLLTHARCVEMETLPKKKRKEVVFLLVPSINKPILIRPKGACATRNP